MTVTDTNAVTYEERKVIFASLLGTVFEWYDFYLYGSLATIISKQFFSGVNETTAFIFALMAFAVRPFGATTGQAVVWYTGQFYALFFLTKTLLVDDQTANLLIAAGLLIGTPFFLIFGANKFFNSCRLSYSGR